LDLLRAATVDAVEAIQRWRSVPAPRPRPYVFGGVNYLLRMASDLDALGERHPALAAWLGFPLRRNPFAVPLPMEQRPASAAVLGSPRTAPSAWASHGDGLGGGDGGSALPADADGYTLLGGRRNGNGSSAALPPQAGYGGGGAGTTAIGVGTAPSAAGSGRGGITLGKSAVSDLDMIRVRAAERVLLQEEALFGRFERDRVGRLLPAAAA
ncbi:unnamed protein product, partial [Phaeothamnion confervicola]